MRRWFAQANQRRLTRCVNTLPALTETRSLGRTRMATHCHNTPGLPDASLLEIHDCLVLALDVTEHPYGYTQTEREPRSYVRAALRHTTKLIGGAQ